MAASGLLLRVWRIAFGSTPLRPVVGELHSPTPSFGDMLSPDVSYQGWRPRAGDCSAGVQLRQKGHWGEHPPS